MKLMSVLLACICSLSGCSVTGYLIGSEIDGNAAKFDTLSTYNSLDPGDEIIIYKKDGSTTTGTMAEPLRHLSFEQRVAKITGTSSAGFDLSTGSFSNPTQTQIQDVPTTIVLKDLKNDDVRLSTDSIQRIVAPHEKHAALTGLVVGAVIDIAIVAIASSISKSMFRGPMFGSSKW
jgi:hypothetical protein